MYSKLKIVIIASLLVLSYAHKPPHKDLVQNLFITTSNGGVFEGENLKNSLNQNSVNFIGN